jgi:hypothetical protein
MKAVSHERANVIATRMRQTAIGRELRRRYPALSADPVADEFLGILDEIDRLQSQAEAETLRKCA